MTGNSSISLKYSKLKILRVLAYSFFYGGIGFLLSWFFYSAIERGHEIQFNEIEVFLIILMILCLFFASFLFIKWFPCLFVRNSHFTIDERGITFKPNIGFFTIPWIAKSQFLSWLVIEEYWFHGARTLGEQSMVFGAYSLCLKLKNSDTLEMINLGPLAWSYPTFKQVIEKYTKHAKLGGN